MNRTTLSLAMLAAFCLQLASTRAQPARSYRETPAQRDERTAWWRDARFGPFIHWDMSSLAGTEISWSRKGPKPLDIYGDKAGYAENPAQGAALNFWHIPETWSLIRSLQPQIVINNRLAALRATNNPPPSRGDFDTPEQELGKYQDTRLWESCMTVVTAPQGGWSYRPDGVVKSSDECIRLLASCPTGDGNLLLDVGPDATGVIPADQSARLVEMGKWLQAHGESSYGTRGGPFKPGEYGGTTRRGHTIYVHVFKWPQGALKLPPVAAKLVRARRCGGGGVDAQPTDTGFLISVPEADREPADTVVALEFAGDVMGLPVSNVPLISKTGE